MELLLSVVLGEAIGRSIDFFISKCSQSSHAQDQDVEGRLRRVLLRAQLITEEAMGRQVTNQAMLLQLDMLRDTMYRGCYMLDTFRYRYSHGKEDAEYQVGSQPFSLRKVSSSKYFCSSNRKAHDFQQLREVLHNLSSMILDAKEMVIFLSTYPHMYRQPYSMHLLLANCMFDRQMETQYVISFLLRTQPHGAKELEVLPIVGPRRVGKSTLVAHICNDKRIRDHFSEIIFLTDPDFRDKMRFVPRHGCAMENHNGNTKKDGRLLVIIEVDGDVTQDAWSKFYSAFRPSTTNGTKIIITSQSDKVTKLGTTCAITLAHPSSEAYWYFFKTIAFGSTDPEQHPRLASVAMEIARMLSNTTRSKPTLVTANITATLLRDNFDISIWRKVLAFLRRDIQNHIAKFGESPADFLTQNKPSRLGRMMGRASEDIMVYDQYHCSSQEAVPSISLHDVMYGNVKPDGKFEVLAWRSQIPPYYSYIYTCQIQDLETKATKRKRCQNCRIAP